MDRLVVEASVRTGGRADGRAGGRVDARKRGRAGGRTAEAWTSGRASGQAGGRADGGSVEHAGGRADRRKERGAGERGKRRRAGDGRRVWPGRGPSRPPRQVRAPEGGSRAQDRSRAEAGPGSQGSRGAQAILKLTVEAHK